MALPRVPPPSSNPRPQRDSGPPATDEGLNQPTPSQPTSEKTGLFRRGPKASPEEVALKRLEKVDWNQPLNAIDLAKYGVDVTKLPLFQESKGRMTSYHYKRELRLVRDDGNSRGPVVVDPDSGALFRLQPKSEFEGKDPVLQIDDFDADDLNLEASVMLGHLQRTSDREKQAILLAKKAQKMKQAREAQEARDLAAAEAQAAKDGVEG